MAKKESKNIERVYTVPLRKEYQKVPRWRRTKKAVKALREFLQRHMKSEDIKLAPELNEAMWNHGMKNPPHHVKVNVSKDGEGVVKAQLFGLDKKGKKEEKQATDKKEEVKKVDNDGKNEKKEETNKKEKIADEIAEEVKEEVKDDIPTSPETKTKEEKEEAAEKISEEVKEDVEEVAEEIAKEK